MQVVYSGPTLDARVLLVGSGSGSWHTSSGARYGQSPLEVAARIRGCRNFYSHDTPDDSRNYDPELDQAVMCEVRGPGGYFYVTFNAGNGQPSALAGFGLSSRRMT